MPRHNVFFCFFVWVVGFCPRAEAFETISQIASLEPIVQGADPDTLFIFDVDYVLTAPRSLLGRPKALNLRRQLFQEYKKKYGQARADRVLSRYFLKVGDALVEPKIKSLIAKLQKKGIPTVALTAIGTGTFGDIKDPVALRHARLKSNGLKFHFKGLNQRVSWGNGAVYASGIIFSGKESKGDALAHFLGKLARWTPKRIVFVDDSPKCLESVEAFCRTEGIPCRGFLYKARSLEKDPPLPPEVARLQLRALDEKNTWIPDAQAYQLVHRGRLGRLP